MAAMIGDESDVPPTRNQPPWPYRSSTSNPVFGSATAATSAATRWCRSLPHLVSEKRAVCHCQLPPVNRVLQPPPVAPRASPRASPVALSGPLLFHTVSSWRLPFAFTPHVVPPTAPPYRSVAGE